LYRRWNASPDEIDGLGRRSYGREKGKYNPVRVAYRHDFQATTVPMDNQLSPS
jgi:hypothetical protein